MEGNGQKGDDPEGVGKGWRAVENRNELGWRAVKNKNY